ncbi:MAG TPA: hypothetical protein VGM13_13180 [Thermoanaerobaculia bacterium]|jgi:hypothetical protein
MKAFAAVFAREVAERRMVFLVGLCCGVPTLVASAFHGWNTPGNADVRLLAASVGGLALAVALALLYGGSMIPGETAEKRISFYFSRPIPAAAIWAGKLLAAVFVSFSAGFLVFLPGWLTGPAGARALWGVDLRAGQAALAGLALVAGCVFAAHAVVTVARLRSPWVALDLLLAPALVLLGLLAVRSIARGSVFGYDGMQTLQVAAMAALAVVGAGLILATFAQVGEGRTDARRAHGAFSATFFGFASAAVAALGGYAFWCASADATDLEQLPRYVTTAPRGSWLYASGSLRGWRGDGAFLFDAASGRSIRVRGVYVVFSQDGTRAAWGEPRFGFFEGKNGRWDLHVADLATGRSSEVELEPGSGGWMVLSPSGRRIAVRKFGSLAAFDVSDAANPKQLAVFPLPEDGRSLGFAGEDTLLLIPRYRNSAHHNDLVSASLEIAEFSLSSKRSRLAGRFERETMPFTRLSADGRFLLGVRRRQDAENTSVLTLHEVPSGAVVATLAEGFVNVQARFLTGNRIAVAGIAGASAKLLFFEGEKGWGAPSRSVDLGPALRIVLGGEIAAGRVAVALLPFEGSPAAAHRASKLSIVDAANGSVVSHADGLVPADRFGWWNSSVLPPAEAGVPWTSLFLDADGRLVRLDPATGSRTVLLGKGK